MFDYEDQYCPSCGLLTKEKMGHLYKCPKCGGQMRKAKTGMYNDETHAAGKGLIYFAVFVVLFAIGTATTIFLGLPLGIIGVYLVRRFMNKNIKDKAILIK
jgi:ssDNA-binding Zn-finger/Zn-ribbon topoisomerase 1